MLAYSSFVFGFLLACNQASMRFDPDEHLNMTQIVKRHGYPIQQHSVTTEDGYVMTVFRISHGIEAGNRQTGKPVVLLQHALLCSSFDWVNMAPNQSLGYILADAGFDVWLGNNRGNTYSMRHTKFSVNTAEFWNFTYDDMAMYDLPANVDYILRTTGQKTLSYVGHSQGTLQGFAGFSRNETLAAKIDIFIALAPVAYVHHMTSPIFKALTFFHVSDLFKLFGVKQFLPANGFLNKVGELFCKPLDRLCNAAIFLFCGRSSNINATRLPVYLAHTPAGTSVKNMDHWSQGVRSEVFQMYDYGNPAKNIAAYGQSTPPAYNLRKMVTKVALFTGGRDILADSADVKLLREALPSAGVVHQQNFPDYAHLDFAWASNANTIAYPSVIAVLNNYSRSVVTSPVVV